MVTLKLEEFAKARITIVGYYPAKAKRNSQRKEPGAKPNIMVGGLAETRLSRDGKGWRNSQN